MELFATIINVWELLTVAAKSSIVDTWLGSEYASKFYHVLRATTILMIILKSGLHVAKSVRIWSYSGPYFTASVSIPNAEKHGLV